jgi:pyruvate formate lyase activating enzyme
LAIERAALEQTEGTVIDVQRYSLEDGPGVRTSVFLKGCPLRCGWCSNPESQRVNPELMFWPDNCLACGACLEVCASEARSLTAGAMNWDRASCSRCGECVEICPAHAMVWSGRLRSAGDVIREVLRDAPFYEDGGGLTLTGGEPTLQPAFARALLHLAREEHLDTAVETSGNAPWESVEMLSPYVGLWLFDLKHLDSQVHRQFTGVGNELILSNLGKLARLGAPIRVRVPLIPGVNLTQENLRQTAAYVETLGEAVRSVDLLPFHKLGTAKYQALGRTPLWPDPNLLPDDRVKWAAEQMQPYNIKVRIVGDRTSEGGH